MDKTVLQVGLIDAVVSAEYLDRGIAQFRRNRFREALMFFDSALRFKPDDPFARWNRATALLSLGEYEDGFVEHDVAWQLFKVVHGAGPLQEADYHRLKKLPMWRGEKGARVLIYHEMGFGDAIMAFRFLPELKQRAAATLVVDRCLMRLARGFDIEVVDRLPDNVSGYDFRLPFFGVMSALKHTATSIPAGPYIPTNWRNGGNRVGIAWSGRTQSAFTLQYFLSMLDHAGFELYALQPGPTVDGVKPLREGCDFADVAERIAEMDHIATVDTASIHLAGAMGHPSAHLLLPLFGDWRWWHTERWYPGLRTFRQDSADDWHGPFARLNDALTRRNQHG